MRPRSERDRVLRKVAHYWPNEDPEEIMRTLDEYGVESSERGRARVQLAILKLSEGRRQRLPGLVGAAKRDYRDVLAYAESPEEMKAGPIEMRKLTPEDAKALRRRDRDQYRTWLKG